ncbi:MAG: Jag N-terminal domain-containing protein [Anaerolineae bacterium]|nr:Jag N-terminal domain-containing protein [Anaerolineae bacterium]NUQ02296.1 Jag N-terminal domain-containing protein [Anaerolineae bacterium]
MSLQNDVEVTGESIEDAIRKGLASLNAAPYEVIVEVLEEPSSGMFGGEARPARVRLKRLSMPMPPMQPPPPSPPPPRETAPPTRSPERDSQSQMEPAQGVPATSAGRGERGGQTSRDRQERPRQGGGRDRRDGRGAKRGSDRRERQREEPSFAHLAESDLPTGDDYGVSDEESPLFEVAELVLEADQDEEAQVGKVVLETLLEHMELNSTIEVRRSKAAEEGESAPWVLNITGSRWINRLVGRRGETLASLQYLTRLITSRELQRRAELIVDVDGYKAKRAASLRALAVRMADDAVRDRRVVTLEPMPPHERRIIHLALRERPDVTTRSVGEGAGRKVTIVPSAQE